MTTARREPMIVIDGEVLSIRHANGSCEEYNIGTPEAFGLLSRLWLRSGWDLKYVYSFTWLGRPVVQLPEDLIRLQEVIYRVKPDVIIETGVAHGGSLVFYASLCKAMHKGRVIGVDIEIRPANRRAIESHELSALMTLIEGDSIDPAIVAAVTREVKPNETTLILLDSNHSKRHVQAELQAYAPLVTPGSYVVVMDGIMEDVAGAPRTQPDWTWNNPRQATLEFLSAHPEFAIEEPAFPFNEGRITTRVTYWPSAFVKRLPG